MSFRKSKARIEAIATETRKAMLELRCEPAEVQDEGKASRLERRYIRVYGLRSTANESLLRSKATHGFSYWSKNGSLPRKR